MNKKQQEIMNFLQQKVFDPVLASPNASQNAKAGVRNTIMKMQRLPESAMVQFFWDAVDKNSKTNGLLKQQGLPRFTEPGIAKEFGEKFTDAWLGSNNDNN